MNNVATLAVGIADAAAMTGVSQNTIRRAVKATDPNSFPPPLRARKVGNGPSAKLIFTTGDLAAWVESFPDA